MRPNTSTRRSVLLSLLILGMTVLAVPIAGAASNGYENTSIERAVNESASTAKAAPNTHTLVIKTTGKPITYTVSASKQLSISSNKNESIDSVQGTSVTGRVGGKKKNKDTTDIVTYRGYIESFQAQGNNVRVFLDGKRVPPSVLSANHIRISSPKNKSKKKSQSTKYKISVSGRATQGESTNKQDTAKNGTIRGQITGDSDSFYFTGKPTHSSSSDEVIISINGQNFSRNQNSNSQSSTPTSPQTSPSTGAPETATDSQSMAPSPTTTQSMAANASGGDQQSNGGSGSSSGSGFIYGLVGGVVAVGLVVFGTILYFRPRKRRW